MARSLSPALPGAAAPGTGRRRSAAALAPALLVAGAAIVLGAALSMLASLLPPALETLLLPALVAMTAALLVAYVRPRPVFALGLGLLALSRTQPVTEADGLLGVCMLVTALGALRWQPRLPAGVALALGLFVFSGVLSTVQSKDTFESLLFEAHTIFFVVLAVWLTSAFRAPGLLRSGVKAYIVGAVLTSALGAAALVVHFPGSGLFVFPNGTRVQGLFLDPNAFATFLVPAAVILLEELMRPRLLGWRPWLTLAAFLAIGNGVVLSFSRAGIANLVLSCLVVVAVYALRRGQGRRLVRGVVVLGACAVAGFAVLVATGSLDYLQERSQTQSYDTDRFESQRYAFDAGSVRPLGHGPGAVEIDLPLSTHSTFVWSLYETGPLGFAALLLLLSATALALVRAIRRDVDLHGLGPAALLAAWIGLTFNGLVVDTYHYRILWVLAALAWVVATEPARTARRLTTEPQREPATAGR